ncbi:MAG: GxxExxY protein [Ignavibacteria bacterium]
MSELIYKDEVNLIIGAAIEVQRNLGSGFLEPVYQEALEIEFIEKRIPYLREKEMFINYKDKVLQKKYIADFICYQDIIIELKVCEGISKNHISQVLNYLNATKSKLGVLINFGKIPLEFKRIAHF